MKLSRGKILSLGMQHVLAMYAGAVAVPLVVGAGIGLNAEQLTYLVSIDILMCGLATLLQVWKGKYFGIGLPVVLGCTFTAAGPMIAIGNAYGMTAIFGAIIGSGILVLLFARSFSKLVSLFPPVVMGSVVTIIGLTLIPVAMTNLAGGSGSPDFGAFSHLALGTITLFIILLIFRLARGFLRSIAILLGIMAGTGLAAVFGYVDFTPVQEATWLHWPRLFYFGVPEFHPIPIVIMTIVAIVSLVESSGTYFALSDICEKELTDKDLCKGYRSEGLAYVIGGLFNAFPYTSFSQNVGLIQLSGVKSLRVIYAAAGILVILGFVPKIAAFTTIIPSAVLGGAMIAMFGMVIASGIKMLAKVDFSAQENLLIVACSIGVGLGIAVVPDLFNSLPAGLKIITESGIVMGSVTAFILNLVFNVLKPRGGKAVPVELKQ